MFGVRRSTFDVRPVQLPTGHLPSHEHPPEIKIKSKSKRSPSPISPFFLLPSSFLLLIERALHPHPRLRQHVRVNLRRRYTFVPHQLPCRAVASAKADVRFEYHTRFRSNGSRNCASYAELGIKGTVSPPTCWKRASNCRSSSGSWATAAWPPPAFISTSAPSDWRRSRAPCNCWI
jgi:hypothetical protein